MRYVITFMLAILVGGGAAAYYLKARSLQVRNQALAAEKAAAEQKARSLESEKARAEEQGKKLMALADELGAELNARKTVLTNQAAREPQQTGPAAAGGAAGATPSAKSGFGKMLSNMMSDPDMRNFIREQQRTMLDQLYSPLVKRINLSDDEAARFKEMVLENMMKGAEKGMAMFAGEGPDREQATKALAEDQKRFDEEIRSFLGESRYQEYKDYSLTMQERAQFNLFKQTDPAGAASISDQQTEQLLSIMAEEKKNMAGSVAGGASQEAMAMEALGSEDGVKKLVEMQEGINARVYERASEVLDASQLGSFARFQSNQLQQLRFGMSMARKMFQQ